MSIEGEGVFLFEKWWILYIKVKRRPVVGVLVVAGDLGFPEDDEENVDLEGHTWAIYPLSSMNFTLL